MQGRNQRRLPRTGIGRGGAATMKNEPNDALSREISAALEGVNLQAIDSGSKPKGRGTMRGVIAGISGDDVFVDLGPRMQGVISLREFDSPPKEGAALDFELAGREDELWKLTRVREKAPIASGKPSSIPGVGAVNSLRYAQSSIPSVSLKTGTGDATISVLGLDPVDYAKMSGMDFISGNAQDAFSALGSGERIPTLLYNGYGEQVAALYKGMDAQTLFM